MWVVVVSVYICVCVSLRVCVDLCLYAFFARVCECLWACCFALICWCQTSHLASCEATIKRAYARVMWRARRKKESNLGQKGLRDRNSPTCTLSQNGYGAETTDLCQYAKQRTTFGACLCLDVRVYAWLNAFVTSRRHVVMGLEPC